MNDYHGTDTVPAPQATPDTDARGKLVRPLLWLLLVLSLACDVVISSMHVKLLVELPVGLIGFSCIVGLVVHHYRYQRRPLGS